MPVQVTVVNNAPEVVITILGAAEEERKEHRPKKRTPETEVTEGKHRGKSFAYAAADVHYAKWLVSQKGRLKKTNLIELVEYIEAHL